MSARAALREGTRAAHEALDARFSRLDLSRREDYATFLLAHAAAFLPVEAALTEAGAGRLFPEWREMVRGHWLVADLAALGLAPPATLAPPPLGDDAAIVGAAYVLEGSRLGAAVLRKGIGETLPRAFLDHHPALHWPQFVAEIERLLERDVDRARAIASATAVFDVFCIAAEAAGIGGA